MTILNSTEWKAFLTNYPDAHLLQTAEWGALKSDFGWGAAWVAAGETGAQLLFRRLPLGFSLAYIPKGPLGPDWEALWPEIEALCKQRRAVFLKVEPDAWEGEGAGERLRAAGFRPSSHEIQPRRTVELAIDGDEDAILAAMKQKTRYNIRLAARKEVTVAPSPDVESFSQMMDVTGQRDAFGVHSLAYYRRTFELFHPAGACQLLTASYQGQPLAGLMAFRQGKRAWYFYGASTNQHRNRMPAYLLQWEAIRWAKEKGCTSYDLWGVPDADKETLEAQFSGRSDGLWGVYRFKRGFGGRLKRSAGAWDKIYNRALYAGYQVLMARKAN